MPKLWTRAQMLQAYAAAKLSGRNATPETIRTRQLSCFGRPEEGIAPCPELRGLSGRRYCGACGCGPRPEAILDFQPDGHSKLQFTVLTCPRKRPGFSNAETPHA